MKSGHCSWSCDAQTNEKIKAFFLNPKLLTFLELQSISCIVFAHVTCNTSNQRGEKNPDDFVLSIYFCKIFKIFVDKTTRSYCCVHFWGCSLSYRGRFHNSLSFITLKPVPCREYFQVGINPGPLKSHQLWLKLPSNSIKKSEQTNLYSFTTWKLI